MKSYIKTLMIAGMAAGMASCTDLDTPLDNRYVTLPDNPIAIEGEFNACYRVLNGWFGRDFNEGVVNQGDEVMGCCYTLGNYYDDGRAINGSIHSLTLNNWNCRMIGACMEGCTLTNEKITSYGGPNRNDPVVAPLRAMRAYYHFWMMELWGDVPIMDHVMAENERVDRQPRAKVAKFIEQELLEILDQKDGLSRDNNLATYGKPNRWMAVALLAKLYLNWGVYTHDITTVNNDTPNEKLDDCVKYCDELINCGHFEVGKGYRKKFYPDNGVQIKDFIYAIDADPASGKGDGSTTWYRWFGFKKYGLCKPDFVTWDPQLSLAGTHVLTKECLSRFCLPGDERNQIVLNGPQVQVDNNYNFTNIPLMFYLDPTRENTLIGQLTYVGDFEFDDASIYSLGDEASPKVTKTSIADGTAYLNIRKGARLYKYPANEVDYTLYNRQQSNDSPIFRLADILLMKAECLMRGAKATNGDTPASLINQVRDCSNAPHIEGNVSWDDLLDERSRELILEPWRRNDLIRCGRFEDDWGEKNKYKVWDDDAHTTFHWVDRAGAKDPNRRLMPIHREILESNTNWQQNPGYQGI